MRISTLSSVFARIGYQYTFIFPLLIYAYFLLLDLAAPWMRDCIWTYDIQYSPTSLPFLNLSHIFLLCHLGLKYQSLNLQVQRKKAKIKDISYFPIMKTVSNDHICLQLFLNIKDPYTLLQNTDIIIKCRLIKDNFYYIMFLKHVMIYVVLLKNEKKTWNDLHISLVFYLLPRNWDIIWIIWIK